MTLKYHPDWLNGPYPKGAWLLNIGDNFECVFRSPDMPSLTDIYMAIREARFKLKDPTTSYAVHTLPNWHGMDSGHPSNPLKVNGF